MTFRQFEKALSRLRSQYPSGPPREELKAVYDEIRNSTAHELAVAIDQRDKLLMQVHKNYLTPR